MVVQQQLLKLPAAASHRGVDSYGDAQNGQSRSLGVTGMATVSGQIQSLLGDTQNASNVFNLQNLHQNSAGFQKLLNDELKKSFTQLPVPDSPTQQRSVEKSQGADNEKSPFTIVN